MVAYKTQLNPAHEFRFKQTRVLMPSKGIAYQPRATPWERGFVSTIRSEGTAHNRFRVYDTQDAAFLQNAKLS